MVNIPDDMYVPAYRRDVSNVANLRWLIRNLGVNNRHHNSYDVVIEEIKRELKDYG